MTKIFLIRHGQTKWNVLGRYQGQSDIELSELGLEQAKLLAAGFPETNISAVYASDLQRAYHTAACVADVFGLKVQARKGLREIDFGDWEGKTYKEIVASWPDAGKTFFSNPEKTVIPAGESLLQYKNAAWHLCRKSLKRIREKMSLWQHMAPLFERFWPRHFICRYNTFGPSAKTIRR
jgi:alpha-ribazole phosphatase